MNDAFRILKQEEWSLFFHSSYGVDWERLFKF